MINLRYHVVSITAVFLALGIGIAMGSSFLGAAAVDRVDDNIRDVSREAAQARSDRDEAQEEVERLGQLEEEMYEQGPPTQFTNDLTDVPVVLIAASGADDDSLDAVRTALASSQAQYDGLLRANDKLVDEGFSEELAEVIDVAPDERGQLLDDVAVALGGELSEHSGPADDAVPPEPGEALPPPDEPSPPGAPSPPEPSVLRSLIETDFLSWEPADAGPDADAVLTGAGYRYVVVTSADPEAPTAGLIVPLLEAMAADGPAPVVLASAAVGADAEEREANRAASLAVVREDETLRARISTVDDLEVFAGIAAVVGVVEELEGPVRGHYGLDDDRDALLPPA